MKKNKIKDTGLEVTELSFGTSSLGSMPDTYGYEVPEDRAQKTLSRFFKGLSICLIRQEIMQWVRVKKELEKQLKIMEDGLKAFFYLQN